MPSPASRLRAPLLWLLVPLMAGFTAAKLRPVPEFGLLPLAMGAVVTCGLSLWSGLRAGRGALILWALSLVITGGLAGFIFLHLREPALHQWEQRPPREITFTVHVQQAFLSAASARTLSGLAEIVATEEMDRELLGRRIYYSAIRRISVVPRRSGIYRMQGVIEPLPRDTSGIGFDDYLKNLGIRHRLTRAHVIGEIVPPGWFQAFCTRAQDRMKAILRRGLESQPQTASLYLAMVLGEKADLSTDQQNAFMRSGTFHIFSISGLHVSVIGAALYVFCNLLRVPRRATIVAGLLILWFYVQITGASTPALRAFLMIAFLSARQIFHLPGNALAALAASALATLLLDPLQLFSTGFQMSYTVVIALVVMGGPLRDKWLAHWQPFALLPKVSWRWHHRAVASGGRLLINMLMACWVAFLASAPSSIGYFQVFSPGSLPANLLIIPLSTVTMWAGFFSLVAGLTWLGLLCLPANLLAALTIRLMDWLLRTGIEWPGAYFTAQFRTPWLAPVSLLIMTAVMLTCASGGWKRRYGGFWPPVATLVLLVILGVKFG